MNNWNDHWKVINEEFEAHLQSKPFLHHPMGKMFHIWDENHTLQAWYPYINEVHVKNKSRHLQITSWMFDANMDNHHVSLIHNGWSQCVSTISSSLNIIYLWHNNDPSNFLLWAYMAIERAHVTSSFMHLIWKVNMVGLTRLTKWENVLKEKNDECLKKAKKTWYNLNVHAMIELFFKGKCIASMYIIWSMNLILQRKMWSFKPNRDLQNTSFGSMIICWPLH